MEEKNDYELLYYWRQKEERVFQTLRNAYKPFAYKIVNTCLSSAKQCFGYKDDLIEEALFSLLEAAEAYRESHACSFGSFFYTCAYRRVKTVLRHYLRESNYGNLYAVSLNAPIKEEEGMYLIDYCPDTNLRDPAEILRYQEGIRGIKKVLGQLSHFERKAWYLYQDGVSYQDAAQQLNCSEKKYDNQIQKIKRLIKECLNE